MPRLDAYANLTNEQLAAEDQLLVWDASAPGVRNVAIGELDERWIVTSSNYARRSRGSSLIAIGDSIIATSASGQWVDQLATLSGGRFQIIRNAGLSGNTSAQMLSRITADVIAYAPAWCLLQVTPNDVNLAGADKVAASIANYKAMVGACHAAGIRPILVLGPPNDTAGTRAHILNVNAHLAQWCASEGVAVLDIYTPLADPADGTYLAAYTSDGTHPLTGGMAAAAAFNVDLLPADMQPPRNLLAAGLNDPNNMILNGLFTADANADGLSDSWSKSGTGTTTRTVISTGSGAGYWQNIAPIDTTLTQVYQDVTTIAGRAYEIACRVKATGSGYRMRTPDTGAFGSVSDVPTSSTTAVTMGDLTEAMGAVLSRRFVAAGTTSRILLGAGGAVGTTSFGQVTMRDLTAIDALA